MSVKNAVLAMRAFVLVVLVSLEVLGVGTPVEVKAANETVSVVLTKIDQSALLSPQSDVSFAAGSSTQNKVINVDENETYQQIDGFGASLTQSSVWEMYNKMSQTQRNNLMTNFFDPVQGIGLSLLRQPLGKSDQSTTDQPCSYDDNGGNPDSNLANFSIAYDHNNYIITAIQQAMSLNPSLKVMGSVWCIPGWMIQYPSSGGSSLNSSYYNAYANYLVKTIQAYAAQQPSIPIWAITPQNEPLGGVNFNDGLSASQENDLIKGSIGPIFSNNQLTTKILDYDHSWGDTSFPDTILADSVTNPYVAGTAWHYYSGTAATQTLIHNEYPNKGNYFTEGSPYFQNSSSYFQTNILSNQGINQYFDVLRNWGKTYIQWTLASNLTQGPGSCSLCGPDAYVDDNTGNVTFTSDYYIMGHFSKYVKPNSYRIDSDDFGANNLRSVAFKNPDNSKAMVVFNSNSGSTTFGVNWGNENFTYTLPAYAFATFMWSGTQAGNTPTQSVVKIDDTDPAIAYSGNWSLGQEQSQVSYYRDSVHYTTAANSYAQYNFTGSSLKIYGDIGPDQGKADIYIDNVFDSTIDDYSSSASHDTPIYTKSGLSNTSHTIKLVERSDHNSSSTNYYLAIDAFEYNPSLIKVDGDAYSLSYSGGWYLGSNPANYLGTTNFTFTANNSVQFSFVGSLIRWYGDLAPDQGKADVYIDNTLDSTVDLYQSDSSARGALVYSKTGLGSGTHTIKIVSRSDHNAASSNYYINIDALEYAATPTVLDDTSSNISYNNFYSYSGQPSSFYYQGTVHATNTTNAYFQYTCSSCTGLTWLATRNSDQGIANVYIDGVVVTSVDNYASSHQPSQVIFNSGVLSSGQHTIKVVVSDNHNSSSSNYWIECDALQVISS